VLVLSIVVSGCGGPSEVPTVPVSGSVRVQGKPAEGAIVVLHPVAGGEAMTHFRPQGECDAEGAFRVRTYVEGDGAPPGEYRVTICWPGPNPDFAGVPLADLPRAERFAGPDRLGEKYQQPESTGLTATVGPGATILPAFELP